MRSVYDEFFYIPKHGKIREKVMLARTAVTVFVMLLCLAGMSFTAYAYFSSDTKTVVSPIQAANFDLDVCVTDSSGATMTSGEDGIYALHSGNYTVTLKRGGTANTGFCVIETDADSNIYHTAQLGISGETIVSEISFTLELGGDVSLKFTPHWGTSRYYASADSVQYITAGETVHLGSAESTGAVSISGDDNATDLPPQETPDDRTPVDTEPPSTAEIEYDTEVPETTAPIDTATTESVVPKDTETVTEPPETTEVTEEVGTSVTEESAASMTEVSETAKPIGETDEVNE